mgnify:CR=1 FL=1
MSTIYLNNPPKPIRPPHSNDCNGHNTSISVGGNGHRFTACRRLGLEAQKLKPCIKAD